MSVAIVEFEKTNCNPLQFKDHPLNLITKACWELLFLNITATNKSSGVNMHIKFDILLHVYIIRKTCPLNMFSATLSFKNSVMFSIFSTAMHCYFDMNFDTNNVRHLSSLHSTKSTASFRILDSLNVCTYMNSIEPRRYTVCEH